MFIIKKVKIIILVLLLFQTAFSQEEEKLRRSIIYCDSLINPTYYKAVYRDSIIPNNFYLKAMMHSDLLDKFSNKSFSKLSITTLTGESFSSDKYSINGRVITLNNKNHNLSEIKNLRFKYKGSISNSLLTGLAVFWYSGFAFSIYEGYDSLIGKDRFEVNQVLITASVSSIIGFIIGGIGYEDERINFIRD